MKGAVALVLVSVMVTATPAWADEHEELLAKSLEAEFTGEEVITCTTPDGVRDAVIEISQRDGIVYVTSAAGGTTVAAGAGNLAVVSRAGSVVGISVAAGDELPPSNYTSGATEETTLLTRVADRIEVSRENVARGRLWFDRETGALLRTDTLNKNGSVYCSARMVGFTPGEPEVIGIAPAADAVKTFTSITKFDSVVFPKDLAGFTRLDVYAWDTVGEVAFYSDGFFSFVLYHADQPIAISGSVGVKDYVTDRGTHQRVFTPGRATYVWETPAGGMVLMGDMPIDMQGAVLAKLPAPGKPGLLTRLIRKIFTEPVNLS